MKTKNEIVAGNNDKELTLIIHSKHGVFSVLFDAEDRDKVEKYNWSILKSGKCFYAVSYTYMHKLLTDNKYTLPDHANRNSLDNRKCNLRASDPSSNAFNAIYKNRELPRGVHKRGKRYSYRLVHNKKIYQKTFDTKAEASWEFKRLSVKLYGEHSPFFEEVELI